ncbi:unnamed protein product [Symbiodinium sp. CCMP2592]|nr:unnamed protein product [Symbiodinium sp. CCMP2592]
MPFSSLLGDDWSSMQSTAIYVDVAMLCVIGCCLFVYLSDIYRLCPGWGSVRRFDGDGNEDQRAREDLLQREFAQHQAAALEGSPAAAKVYGSIGKPTWGVLEAPTQKEVLVQHPVYGEVKVRENFEETQRLRRESSCAAKYDSAKLEPSDLCTHETLTTFLHEIRWWAKDERYFMAQSQVSTNQASVHAPVSSSCLKCSEPGLLPVTVADQCAAEWELSLCHLHRRLSRAAAGKVRLGPGPFLSALFESDKASQWAWAGQLLSTMRRRSFKDSLVALGGVASSCAKSVQWPHSLSVLSAAAQCGPTPDVVLFNVVIKACERAQQWQRALRLFRQMGLRGAPPNAVSFSTTMTALTHGTRWDLSIRLMEEARGSEELLNKFVFSSAIAACEKGHQWTTAIQILEQAEDAASLNAAISCIAKAFKWQHALDLAASLPSRQVQPSSMTYNASIGATGAGNHWTLALHLFSDMQNSQVQSNNMTLGSLASVLGESSQWPRALQQFEAFEADGGVADAITLSAILAGCAKGSSWEASLALFAGIRARQLDVHVIPCNAAMTACQRAEQWQRAFLLFEEMASIHLSPGRQTWNVAIQACLCGALWESAVHLLQQSEEPDEFAFSAATLAVLAAASVDHVQRSQALALYREACERGAACHLHSFEAGVIDLHGLLAEQAKLAVEASLLEMLVNACLGKQILADLVIVVGVGHHSAGGQPVVGPAVLKLLSELRMPVAPSPTSPGRLVVKAADIRRWLDDA